MRWPRLLTRAGEESAARKVSMATDSSAQEKALRLKPRNSFSAGNRSAKALRHPKASPFGTAEAVPFPRVHRSLRISRPLRQVRLVLGGQAQRHARPRLGLVRWESSRGWFRQG